MAKHLARIHGTEEDKVNCPFYFKIGACRHSDRCSRLHHKPAFSPTLLVKHLYQHPVRQAELAQAAMSSSPPAIATTTTTTASISPTTGTTASQQSVVIDPEQAMEDFLVFFEDMYMEFSKFGRIDALHVVDNLGDHMIGHVYVKFRNEEEASDALHMMNGRLYAGRLMQVEFSPVTDFREARCRDYDEDACARGGFCNFLHVKPVPRCLIRSLEEDAQTERQQHDDQKRRDRDERRKQKKRKREERGKRSSRKSSRSSSSKHRDRDDDDDDNNNEDGGGSAGLADEDHDDDHDDGDDNSDEDDDDHDHSSRGGRGASRSRSRSPPRYHSRDRH